MISRKISERNKRISWEKVHNEVPEVTAKLSNSLTLFAFSSSLCVQLFIPSVELFAGGSFMWVFILFNSLWLASDSRSEQEKSREVNPRYIWLPFPARIYQVGVFLRNFLETWKQRFNKNIFHSQTQKRTEKGKTLLR